ncbi:hypothetical protein KF707_05315 [Candidatus Obscuribacterales bacterium]|nr:hypothetical protein [Candidatus Obscuribacterales bacterium]
MAARIRPIVVLDQKASHPNHHLKSQVRLRWPSQAPTGTTLPPGEQPSQPGADKATGDVRSAAAEGQAKLTASDAPVVIAAAAKADAGAKPGAKPGANPGEGGEDAIKEAAKKKAELDVTAAAEGSKKKDAKTRALASATEAPPSDVPVNPPDSVPEARVPASPAPSQTVITSSPPGESTPPATPPAEPGSRISLARSAAPAEAGPLVISAGGHTPQSPGLQASLASQPQAHSRDVAEGQQVVALGTGAPTPPAGHGTPIGTPPAGPVAHSRDTTGGVVGPVHTGTPPAGTPPAGTTDKPAAAHPPGSPVHQRDSHGGVVGSVPAGTPPVGTAPAGATETPGGAHPPGSPVHKRDAQGGTVGPVAPAHAADSAHPTSVTPPAAPLTGGEHRRDTHGGGAVRPLGAAGPVSPAPDEHPSASAPPHASGSTTIPVGSRPAPGSSHPRSSAEGPVVTPPTGGSHPRASAPEGSGGTHISGGSHARSGAPEGPVASHPTGATTPPSQPIPSSSPASASSPVTHGKPAPHQPGGTHKREAAEGQVGSVPGTEPISSPTAPGPIAAAPHSSVPGPGSTHAAPGAHPTASSHQAASGQTHQRSAHDGSSPTVGSLPQPSAAAPHDAGYVPGGGVSSASPAAPTPMPTSGPIHTSGSQSHKRAAADGHVATPGHGAPHASAPGDSHQSTSHPSSTPVAGSSHAMPSAAGHSVGPAPTVGPAHSRTAGDGPADSMPKPTTASHSDPSYTPTPSHSRESGGSDEIVAGGGGSYSAYGSQGFTAPAPSQTSASPTASHSPSHGTNPVVSRDSSGGPAHSVTPGHVEQGGTGSGATQSAGGTSSVSPPSGSQPGVSHVSAPSGGHPHSTGGSGGDVPAPTHTSPSDPSYNPVASRDSSGGYEVASGHGGIAPSASTPGVSPQPSQSAHSYTSGFSHPATPADSTSAPRVEPGQSPTAHRDSVTGYEVGGTAPGGGSVTPQVGGHTASPSAGSHPGTGYSGGPGSGQTGSAPSSSPSGGASHSGSSGSPSVSSSPSGGIPAQPGSTQYSENLFSHSATQEYLQSTQQYTSNDPSAAGADRPYGSEPAQRFDRGVTESGAQPNFNGSSDLMPQPSSSPQNAHPGSGGMSSHDTPAPPGHLSADRQATYGDSQEMTLRNETVAFMQDKAHDAEAKNRADLETMSRDVHDAQPRTPGVAPGYVQVNNTNSPVVQKDTPSQPPLADLAKKAQDEKTVIVQAQQAKPPERKSTQDLEPQRGGLDRGKKKKKKGQKGNSFLNALGRANSPQASEGDEDDDENADKSEE